jgi:hypothetical protein
MELSSLYRILPLDAPEEGTVKPVFTLKFEDLGERMDVLVHPLEWPKEVIEKHYESYVYVFREMLARQKSEPSLSEEEKKEVKVCLCVDVASCPFKETKGDDPSGIENRSCSFFFHGLCSIAFDPTEEESIPTDRVVAYLARTNPMDIHRRFTRATDKVREAALKNPVIREIMRESPQLKKYLEDVEEE